MWRNSTKTRMTTAVSIAWCVVCFGQALDAQTTAFTYQGTLKDGGSPATGQYDFIFRRFSAQSGGVQLGGDIVRDDVQVTNGMFAVELDSGLSPVTSTTERYLDIAVRAGATTGAYTTLGSRQPATISPDVVSAPAVGLATPGSAARGGQRISGEYKLVAISPLNGLRVQTDNLGGMVASFGGYGDFQIDAPGVVGGRLAVTEGGNVGIGTAAPNSRLTVNGTAAFGGTTANPNEPVEVQGPVAGYSLYDRTGGQTERWVMYSDRTGGAGTNSLRFWSNGDKAVITAGGNVGIGTASPPEKLSVAGTVHSTSGGFKFPDGTVQATAASTPAATTMYHTTASDAEVQLTTTFPDESVLLHLSLPAGTYLLSATIQFRNDANYFNQNNNRLIMCRFSPEPAPNDVSYRYTSTITGLSRLETSFHSVFVNVAAGGMDLLCRPFSWQSNVFAGSRRLTAVRIGGNVDVQ